MWLPGLHPGTRPFGLMVNLLLCDTEWSSWVSMAPLLPKSISHQHPDEGPHLSVA